LTVVVVPYLGNATQKISIFLGYKKGKEMSLAEEKTTKELLLKTIDKDKLASQIADLVLEVTNGQFPYNIE
jgi:hypothetical protein